MTPEVIADRTANRNEHIDIQITVTSPADEWSPAEECLSMDGGWVVGGILKAETRPKRRST